MSTELENSLRGPRYQVEIVEKTDPPAGMPGDNWHRYVICEGDSRIEGFQPGSLQAVTEHAENFAEDLNNRAANGYSVYAARKRK